jgi:hypothetical protein
MSDNLLRFPTEQVDRVARLAGHILEALDLTGWPPEEHIAALLLVQMAIQQCTVRELGIGEMNRILKAANDRRLRYRDAHLTGYYPKKQG